LSIEFNKFPGTEFGNSKEMNKPGTEEKFQTQTMKNDRKMINSFDPPYSDRKTEKRMWTKK